MYGFIVTTHYNNYIIIKKCLDLLFKYIPEESYVILYVNETKCDKVLNIKNDYLEYKDKFDVIYIDNQEKNGGLTGTWNQGINYLLNKKNFNCKVITILGHDSYVNENIKYLLEKALKSEENNELKYFGPLYKNFIGKNDELWQDELHYKKYSNKFIIGSLFTFPVNSLVKNKLNLNEYFDAQRFPFGYNDIDWYNRFIKKGGKAEIVTECIIDHEYKRTWVSVDKNLKNYKSKQNNSNNSRTERTENFIEKSFTTNKIDELNFNWINYLKKNIDLRGKGICNERQALEHYLTIGKIQGRKF